MSSKESRPRVVLVCRAIILDKSGKKFLLIKRSKNDRFMPGKWEFPGGKLDEGQDVSAALYREVLEETSLLVSIKSNLVYFESQKIPVGDFKGLPYIILVGLANYKAGEVKLSSDHEDFKWVTYEEAFDFDLKRETINALKALKDTFI
jgi:8-oxo-dGTP diphosphatase